MLFLLVVGVFFGMYRLIKYVISRFNAVKPLAVRVEEAFSNCLISMQKKVGLTRDLESIAMKYATDESTVMLAAGRDASGGSIIDAYGESLHSVTNITALAQRYPDLKQNTIYVQLMDQLSTLEEDLQCKREEYNRCVREYITPIQQFPMALFAPVLGLEPAEFWKSDDADSLARLKEFKTDNANLKRLLSSASASVSRHIKPGQDAQQVAAPPEGQTTLDGK